MIVKIENKKKANVKELISVREKLGLKKDEMGPFFKSHNIKKIGNRTYIDIENGEKKFDLSKFKDLTKAFNNEFIKLNLDYRTSVQKLTSGLTKSKKDVSYKDTGKELRATLNVKELELENRRYSFTKLWKIHNAENIFNKLNQNYHKKKVMNLGTLKAGSNVPISNLFGYIQKYIKESDFKLNRGSRFDKRDDYDGEIEVLNLADSINRCLDELKNAFGTNLYMGILKVPTVTEDTVNENEDTWQAIMDNKLVEFKLCLSENEILFYYFTDQDPSNITVEHRNEFTEKELQDILDKYPVTSIIEAGKPSDIIISDLCNKIEKKSEKKHIFISQNIFDSNLKFKFDSSFEDFDDAPISDPDPFEEYEPDGKDLAEITSDLEGKKKEEEDEDVPF